MSSMVSESLAVKLRPRTLGEVVGQKPVCDMIKGMVKRRNVPNAILISGDTGSGKTTISRILASIVNCQNLKGADPCGECSSCKSTMHPDFIEMNMGDSRGIDDIRALKQQSQFMPHYNMRVFLLDECHQMTKAGASCLLKLLEEPPEHTVFLLATTDPDKMMNTIIGRCVKLNLRRLTPKDMMPFLKATAKAERIRFKSQEERDKILSQILDATGGQPRDSLQLLEGVANIIASGENVDVLKTFGEQFDVTSGVAAIEVLMGVYTNNPTSIVRYCSIGALGKMLEFHTCALYYMSKVKLDYVSYDRRTFLAKFRKLKEAPDLEDMTAIMNGLVDLKKEFTTFTIDDKQLLIARLLAL